MEIRTSTSPRDFKRYTTEELRNEFLIESIFKVDEIKLLYSYVDRIIVGGVIPINKVKLEAKEELRSQYFLERRELGIINIGDTGIVTIDGKEYILEKEDGIYIGKGSKDIEFSSYDINKPAKFYLNSSPAHMTYETRLIKSTDCIEVELGRLETSNHRVIRKYILPGQVESCQLVMGLTKLKVGSVWNTMPCHTHNRRMEVYLYFNMNEDDIVMHYMGEPTETRHLVVRNEEAVISPSWSIHSGSGSRAYTFIWGMCGENQDFDDMDHVNMKELK